MNEQNNMSEEKDIDEQNANEWKKNIHERQHMSEGKG